MKRPPIGISHPPRKVNDSQNAHIGPRMTKLSTAARRGDTRVEVESPDVCRVGEVVLLGEQEAKMVIDKGSLVFPELEEIWPIHGYPFCGAPFWSSRAKRARELIPDSLLTLWARRRGLPLS